MNTVDPIREIEDIQKMKDYLLSENYRDYLLFLLGINTGLRISDIIKLKVSDVKNKHHIIIKEQKTGKEKKFILNPALLSEMTKYIEHKKEKDYLFPSKRNPKKHIDRTRAYTILNIAADTVKLNIRIGTHTLRKTFGYHFYKKTKDVALLMQIFNHSSPSITLRYIGINQDLKDAAMQDFSL